MVSQRIYGLSSNPRNDSDSYRRVAGRLSVAVLILALAELLAGATPALGDHHDGARDERNAAEPGAPRSLPAVVITATRQREPLLDIPAKVDVVARKDIEQRGDYTIENLFRYQAGIEVARQTSGTDPFDSSGGIEIRGVGGNRTQVLIDGSRTLERITDNTRDVVEASNVRAVEIVRGPSSVLWGSDALGGVVNFTTRNPADLIDPVRGWGADGAITYGSIDASAIATITAALELSERWSGLLSYTRREAGETELDKARVGSDALQPCPRNPEATPCNRLDPQDITAASWLGKLVYAPSERFSLRFTGDGYLRRNAVEQNSVLGDQLNRTGRVSARILSYPRRQDIERWRGAVDLEWSPQFDLLDTLRVSASYSPQESRRTGRRERILQPGGERERLLSSLIYGETFTELDIQATSSFQIGALSHRLTYGFDGDMADTAYRRVDVTDNITRGSTRVRRAGGFNFANTSTVRADIYVQDEIGFMDGRLEIVPGLRVASYRIDPEPDRDYQLVPGAEPRKVSATDTQFKLGALFRISERWSIYANYSQGFKMPTAQQLFQSLSSLPFFALVPNRDLRPESVDSYEIGLRADLGARGYVAVNAFSAQYDDFILNFVNIDPTRFGLAPGTLTLTYDNVDAVDVRGLELEGVYRLNDYFYLAASMSLQDGKRENKGVKSEHLGALPPQWVQTLGYANGGLDVRLVGTFQAGGGDVNNAAKEFQPAGYAVFDLLLSYEFGDRFMIRANVFNLADRRYFAAESIGFPINASAAVQRVNPLEAQAQPGRSFSVGVSARF